MAEVFYHEDLVLHIDHAHREVLCGHVEGEALPESALSSFSETTEEDQSSLSATVAPKQGGDKVSENDESAELIANDDEDNQMEQGYMEGPFTGNIYVRWNSSYYRNADDFNNLMLAFEDHISGESLLKLDRFHQLSDVVKHSLTSKVGIITKVRKKAYAEIIGTNKLLVDVDCFKLKNIEKFYPGTSEQLVIYNSWLGRVTSILRDVILKFPDGARLRTSDEIIENFEPIFNLNLPEIIFKGSALKGDARDLKSKNTRFLSDSRHFNSTWLKQLKQKQIVEVIIVKVIISSAKVDWLMYKPISNVSQSDIEIPPTIIKGVNVQNLKSVHSNPFLFSYTGDIWYYQLKVSDKVFNLNEEYTVAKMLYRIYMKENINNLRYVIKPNKGTKSNDVKGVVDKKNEKGLNKKSTVKGIIKSEIKLKTETEIDKKQINQNYRSITKEETNKNVIKKSQSIYPHLQYRCCRNPALFRSNHPLLEKKFAKSSRVLKKEVKFQNSSNRENIISTQQEEHKTTVSTDQRLKVPIPKFPKKLSTQQQKITSDMVINFLGNLNVGTWVPVHLILLESLLDIVWQDGTTSCRIPSIMFIPEMFDLDEYDFFPGDFVSMKKSNEINNESDENTHNSLFGCIMKSKNNERVITVQWFQLNPDGTCIKIGKSEQCGSYDIRHHKKHHYHVGDIVAIASTCEKTTFPAGYVNSVQPNRGRLSIKWHNAKETFLYPPDLYGIVWDIVSDDFFLSSEDSFDLSTLNLQQGFDDKRIDQASLNTNKDSTTSPSTISLVKQILKRIEKIIESFTTPIETKNPSIVFDFVAIADLKKKMLDLRNSSVDKSIQLIYETFISKNSEINDEIKNIKCEMVCNQPLPSTSTFNETEIITTNNEEKNQMKGNTVNDEEIKIEESTESIINKILNLNKSLSNWLKINALSEPHFNQINKNVGTNLIKDTSIENNRQWNPIVLDSVENIKNVVPSDFEHSISVCDDEEFQLNFRKALEGNNPISYDPLPSEQLGFFVITDMNPENHKFVKQTQVKGRSHNFSKAWTRDYNLLTTSLPKGIWVRNYEQRIDLFSVMIEGPIGTPYQFTLFFFDIHIPPEYPDQPPFVHYISLTTDRVNPNLYPDGKVCLSLLGTWIGRGTENWDPKMSNLLQIIISIQGLILVVDPYYNEAGFDHRRGSLDGLASSQRYNESIITSMIVATIHLIDFPVKCFEEQIRNYYRDIGHKYISLLKFWATLDETMLLKCKENQKTSITVESSSELTKGICDNSLKNSRNSDMITYVASMWSDADAIGSGIVNNTKKEVSDTQISKIKTKSKSHKLQFPDFTLAPVSRGFSLTLNKYLILLEKSMYQNYM